MNNKELSEMILLALAIAALEAQVERLRGLLVDVNECVVPCENCEETGNEPGTENACGTCGGYAFNVKGDIREVVIDIRAELAQVTK